MNSEDKLHFDDELWCVILRPDGGLGGYARLTGEDDGMNAKVDRIGLSDGTHMFYTDYPKGDKSVNMDNIYAFGLVEAQYMKLVRLENSMEKAVRQVKLDHLAAATELLAKRDQDIAFLHKQFERLCDIVLDEVLANT